MHMQRVRIDNMEMLQGGLLQRKLQGRHYTGRPDVMALDERWPRLIASGPTVAPGGRILAPVADVSRQTYASSWRPPANGKK